MFDLGKRLAIGAGTILTVGVLYSPPAAAQATRTWISGVGDDVNPCSRTAPCKTFAGAIAKTAAGGEINCLDPGGYGTLTITKSITIVCNYVEGGVTSPGVNAFIVNGSNAIVQLVGLDLEGLGQTTTSPGVNGIYVLNAATVTVRDTRIRGFRNGYGINFAPSANATLILDHVAISESGNTATTTTGGMTIAPSAGVTAKVTIKNSDVVNNSNIGIRVDTSGIVGSTAIVSIGDTRIDGNDAGMLVKVPASTGNARVMLSNSSVSLNTGQGVLVNGGTVGTATIRIGNTAITGNGTGLQALNNGIISSYGNNRLDGNGVDGAFSGVIPTH